MNDKASTIICLAQEHLGDPYVYGAWGSPCTPELRRKYARLNPSHAGNITKKCQALNGGGTSCAGCKWQGALAYDCRGFTHWLLKQIGIEVLFPHPLGQAGDNRAFRQHARRHPFGPLIP